MNTRESGFPLQRGSADSLKVLEVVTSMTELLRGTYRTAEELAHHLATA